MVIYRKVMSHDGRKKRKADIPKKQAKSIQKTQKGGSQGNVGEAVK